MPPETVETAEKVTCSRCDATFPRENAYRAPDNECLCEDCFSAHFFICEDCDNTCWNDDYAEEGRCVSCHEAYQESNSNCIESSDYMPRLIFSKEPWENTLYQGVELEIELPESVDPDRHAGDFKRWLMSKGIAKYLYFKNDGSLDNGYEIVSHPFTSQARHKLLNWAMVLEYLRTHRAKATSSCGMHVHVSRKGLTDCDIKKLKMFFWTNRAMCKAVAGRDENSYCTYENYGLEEYKDNRVVDCDTRYRAVNVNIWHGKKDTVEFRLFKGTLDAERFIGCLQFTEAVCEFMRHARASQLDKTSSWGLFKSWAKRSGKYATLLRFLALVKA